MVRTTYIENVHPLKAAAVTALTRASPGVINIPAGHSGRLKRIISTCWDTITTTVDGGGLVELENDAIKGSQISFVSNGGTCVTLGGHQVENLVIDCDLPIVGPSQYTVWYTPYDASSQSLSVALEWETGGAPDPRRPNYIKADVNLETAAVAAITMSVEHNTIAIPSGKGGRLLGVNVRNNGLGETAVISGGLIELRSSVDDWKPFEFIVPGDVYRGAGGSSPQRNVHFDVNKPLSGNSNVYSDFTPYDDQEQTLGLTLLWRGPDPV